MWQLKGNTTLKKRHKNLLCLFSHKWEGCECVRCGKVRDNNHEWAGCKCKISGTTKNIKDDYYEWEGCKCNKCGAVRDTYHRLEGCKCKKCGREYHIGNIYKHLRDGAIPKEGMNLCMNMSVKGAM
jgi:hypothetical protein